jgi:nucleotide-binding universal stress UspA family protein
MEREGAELLVMGTVCRTGIPGFFIGNTAEMILGQVDCSVLTVKPKDFESPVKLE